MAVAVLNIVLLMRFSASENTKQEAEPAPKKDVSVMGKTRTRIALPETPTKRPTPPPEQKHEKAAEPTEEPEDDSPEIGEEFHPETDEVDEEEVEMEDLFAVTKDDIRLQGTELVANEIARLQKVRAQEDVSAEDKADIQSTVSKLNGSEFLKLLKENEEKAEKRNRELLRMIEAEENSVNETDNRIIENKPVASSSDDISLEDFL